MPEPTTDLFAPPRYQALFSIEGTVRVTGLSRSTVYRAIEAGQLARVYVGTRPYITRTAVVEYLADRIEESEAGS